MLLSNDIAIKIKHHILIFVPKHQILKNKRITYI